MELESRSGEQVLPPLLALPVELKSNIISHLPHDEYPSRACLRRTHSAFFQLIPKADSLSQLPLIDLADQLLRTELDNAYLLPPDHYPCYFCLRVLPLAAFQNSYRGGRRCGDCVIMKPSTRWASTAAGIIWVARRLTDLPRPPTRPQLQEPAPDTLDTFKAELNLHLELSSNNSPSMAS